MLRTLETAAEPHQVVIVNDGSPDGTGDVAEALAARYPGRIEVIHHEINRGYGDAVPYRDPAGTGTDGLPPDLPH